MKLQKLKLHKLSEASLKDKEMNALIGGYSGCYCSCYWEGQGGSSTDDNMHANYNNGSYSTHGCNGHWMGGYGYMDCLSCNESHSGLGGLG
ncbi:TIGR04149 family rSAM-modified RiPP [Bacteroides caecimuris]|uniref:RSAM-modified peptide n=1 Tax=Bacteroides caecimuris TaxID=1796613 RepID=A0A4S2CJ34_9BACE|nr:TIGR04149 family rSAM-modified RiPP [Bacteroides caecimuris]TGY28146.1 rSAM-modified peptide [Bacteroides caecimuris]